MSAPDPLSTAFLLVETLQSTGEPVWVVKWRSADGVRVRRRLGAKAWVDRDGVGEGWRPRDGRPAPGWLTEYQARRRLAKLVEAVESERASMRARAEADAAARGGRGRADVPRARPRMARARGRRRGREAVDAARLPRDARRAGNAVPPRSWPRDRADHGGSRRRARRADHDRAGRGVACRARARGRRRPQREQASPGAVRDLQLRSATRERGALAADRQPGRRGREAARGRTGAAGGLHRRAGRGARPSGGVGRLARTAQPLDCRR